MRAPSRPIKRVPRRRASSSSRLIGSTWTEKLLLLGELLAERESVGRQADGHVGGDLVGDPIRALGPILLEQRALEPVLGDDLVAIQAHDEVARRVVVQFAPGPTVAGPRERGGVAVRARVGAE